MFIFIFFQIYIVLKILYFYIFFFLTDYYGYYQKLLRVLLNTNNGQKWPNSIIILFFPEVKDRPLPKALKLKQSNSTLDVPHGWNGIEQVKMGKNCWNERKYAGICWNRLEYAGIGWNRLEQAGIILNGLEWTVMGWNRL